MNRQRITLLFVPLLCVVSLSCASIEPAQPASETTSIDYASVKDALQALEAKPGVKFRVQDGLTIAEDTDEPAIWMFVPIDHPAYPSVIKRSVANETDAAYMTTNIKCEASQEICDRFFATKN